MFLPRALLASLALLVSAGCVLTDVKIPLDTDLDRTQLGDKVGKSSSQGVLWAVAWGDAGIQAAARDGGIATITHADSEVFSILFGLYFRQTTVVYGE